jgi:hypothetical protein
MQKQAWFTYLDAALVVLLAIIPLFFSFPYRVNIFLSWEGAYRMSHGQLPFRDFGIPLGGMYWVIPALFMKIFGTGMLTLVKAQVFINILNGLAFRSILKSLQVKWPVQLVAVATFCLSYSFINFWPWYNHTVIAYQMVGLALLLNGLRLHGQTSVCASRMAFAALFFAFSFLTKQDAGALGILMACVLLATYSAYGKKWKPLAVFALTLLVFLSAFFVVFQKAGAGYWFNHGQKPHVSRVSLREVFEEFLLASDWIKFYLLLIFFVVIYRFRTWSQLVSNKTELMFLLLVLGILAEAAIFQVTSYTPPDNNIFFHSFAIAYLLHALLSQASLQGLRQWSVALSGLALVFVWWSNHYWTYVQRIFARQETVAVNTRTAAGEEPENVVNRRTYIIAPEGPKTEQETDWAFSNMPVFKGVYMPRSTLAGIQRIEKWCKEHPKKDDLTVLNMSELTPLADAIPFRLEKGSHFPLWFHLGVSMFNKQAVMFEQRIATRHYDLVLFEYIPTLNNFYPFRVRNALMAHYEKLDSFAAPRRGDDTRGTIEVYVPKKADSGSAPN